MPASRPDAGAAAGFAAAAVVGTGLSLAFATGDPIRNDRWALLALLCAWAVVWAVAVACAFRLPRRLAVPAILTVAVLLRLAALAGQPILSDDLYRYAWDGRVQASGIDPYRFPPIYQRVAHLRESWLWPDADDCARLQREEGCTRINRPDVRTIYPPVAEAWFAAVYRVAGIEARHKAWQVAGLLTELALLGLLPAVLRAWKRDERWTALYALSPFPVIEVVNNGHADGLAALLVVLALLATARRRPGWAGALLGAAAMVKLYPAVLGLAFLAAFAGRERRTALRFLAAAAGVAVLAYLPHMLAVGFKVLGYLPGYLSEERYGSGGRYLLAGVLGLPAGLTATLSAAAAVAVAVTIVRRRAPDVARTSTLLFGAVLLAVTPVQPWYALTLLAVATVAGAPAWVALVLAGYPYFFAVILDSPHAVAIGRVSYGLALLTVALGSRLYTRPSTRKGSDEDRQALGGDRADGGGLHRVRRG